MDRILHEKLAVPHFNNKFLAFHGTRRFSTALTTAHHSSPILISFIQSTALPVFLSEPFTIIDSVTCGSPMWSLCFTFTNQTGVCNSNLSHVLHDQFISHSLTRNPNNIWYTVRSMKLLTTKLSSRSVSRSKCSCHRPALKTRSVYPIFFP